MSMARCDLCRDLIDTDDDPEACVHDGYLCESCRDAPQIVHELNHRANEADFSLKDHL
jgi:hypothetical protein